MSLRPGPTRFALQWHTSVGLLRVVEPYDDEVRQHAAALSAFYNDPYNSSMMANTQPLSSVDVVDHFTTLRALGGRAFLLFRDGELTGDADLRHIERGDAEFAFMIGARSAQGKGLGTRLGLMVNAYAFGYLGVERVFASVLPHNRASLRAFEKMGFGGDDSLAARRYAEEASDVTMSIGRAAFVQKNPQIVAELVVARRRAAASPTE